VIVGAVARRREGACGGRRRASAPTRPQNSGAMSPRLLSRLL
jgi:hypothetical protein